MPELYLVRHAQSDNNAYFAEIRDNAATVPDRRTADPGLTCVGHSQAKCLADHLALQTDKSDVRDGVAGAGGYGIGRLYCSAMLRTLQTIQPVAAALGLKPEIWLDVHEEGGIWHDHRDGRGPIGYAGLTRRQIDAQFPGIAVPEEITEDGWWNRPFEPRDDLAARAARVAEDIRRLLAGSEERVAIFSHGNFISVLIQHLLLGQLVPDMRFSHHNTGISRLDFDGDFVMLRYLNRMEHLPADRIT